MVNFWKAVLVGAASLFVAHDAIAGIWNFELGDSTLDVTSNTTVTVGGAVRMQRQSADLIGKTNLDPQLCTGPNGAYQSCQSLFRTQIYQAQRLVSAPGAASVNNDDGDLNYDKGDFVSAVGKITQDWTLKWNGLTFFTRWLYFNDPINQHFTEYHPNRITPENYLQVGRQVPGLVAGAGQSLLQSLANPAALIANPFQVGALLLNARPYGQPGPNGSNIVYGSGGVVRNPRASGAERREIGSGLQWLDVNISGNIPIWDDKELAVKLGRQTVNWGESTTLVINSINQANPVNVNNFYRVGRSTEEIFTPIAMADFIFEPVDHYSVEAFYQFEWKGVESAAPGSFLSDLDIGTNNIGSTFSASVGNLPEDPNRIASPLDSPLAGFSNSTSTIKRLQDSTPNAQGQFGIALKHNFESIGDGVEAGFYFMNYHSRLPLASLYAANPSCARKAGNARGNDATDLASFILDCPDIPFIHSLLHPGEPAQYATDSGAALDSARFQLEYPRNIQLYGVSFNTSVGTWALQGEVAYRPNLPLQIATTDLAFSAFGPTLTNCHDRSVNCAGSAGLADIGIGYAADGTTTNYGSSDFIPAAGKSAYPDILNVGIGHIPGSARAFPSFVIPFRGGQIGENPGCPKGMADSDYHPGIPCYIRGYEREQVYQFNLGATRVLGASDNWLGADQIIVVTEMGATYVPNLPSLDRLQFQAPGVYYHASAGADGSGANGSRQACSTNPACSMGEDGVRFNPHQQDLKSFADPFSWGYRVISFLTYENVLPNIGLHPTVIWSHDVQGTSPGPGGNFVVGRKQADVMLEARYQASLSLNVGYTWFFGGGSYNTLKDRDYLQFFAKYQF